MKKAYILYSLLVSIILGTFACKKVEVPVYSGEIQTQFIDTVPQGFTFLYHPSTVLKDTVWVSIRAIGGITSYDRKVKLVQVLEYQDSLIYDESGLVVIDKKKVLLPFTAKAGKHYVGFDTPEMEKLLVVKAGEVEARLPIVLLRDASLAKNSYRLRLSFGENKDFKPGDPKLIEKSIQFSDRFERFYSWRTDLSYESPAANYFKKYSQRKHQFMYEIIGEPITEEWFKAISSAGAQNHYLNVMREALNKFNSNKENIDAKKAPMREIDDEKSPVIVF